ncbi:MAG: serine hydrolase [Lachnospiraceae bacterium]|nr:serine hydrolase [Lachnospiraceae bacterium]
MNSHANDHHHRESGAGTDPGLSALHLEEIDLDKVSAPAGSLHRSFPVLLLWALPVAAVLGCGIWLTVYLLQGRPAAAPDADDPLTAVAMTELPAGEPIPDSETASETDRTAEAASDPVLPEDPAEAQDPADTAERSAMESSLPADTEPADTTPSGEGPGGTPSGSDTDKVPTVSGNDDSVSGNDTPDPEIPEADPYEEIDVPPMLATSPLEGVLFSGYSPSFTSSTKDIVDEEVLSEYAVLIDLDTGEVVAQRRAKEKMYPASMTKVLTVLVAAEHVPSLTDRFAMTRDITNYCYSNDCSAVCWDVGEKIPVPDLFYGAILPSGADAVLGLCQVCCGNTADFVDLMNKKVSDLGLSNTHFDNPIGLFSEDTYTTPTEMAMLMKAAIENGTAYDALSAHIHTTLPTAEHPDGLTLSNLFLRRIEDHFDKGEVVCAKTGFVNQSLNCAVSYCKSNEGKHYVCVTGKANGAWKCIYDHVRIYNAYLP